MHYSGVVVRTLPRQFQSCEARLAELEGVEIHYSYPDSCSLVAVLETVTLDQQENLLRRMQGVPGVAAADLVYHHFEEATDLGEEVPS